MSVSTEYMGRAYAAPLSACGAGSCVYLNFGWNSFGNQSWPEYRRELFQGVVSEGDYNALRDECLAYLATNGVDAAAGMQAFMLCAACPCIFCPLLSLSRQASRITADLQAITAKHAPAWAASVALELVQLSRPTSRDPGAQAVDADGRLLVSTDEDGTRSVWPPLGYSVVVRTPTRELRSRWPQPVSGALFHAPVALGSPVKALSAAPDDALAALLEAQGMDAAEAGAACAATGVRSLRDVALLSDADVNGLLTLSLVTRKKLANAAAAARG